MYKVLFDDYFFESLENFIIKMKEYYTNFYSNTWLFFVDKIILDYINTYSQLQEEILVEIEKMCRKWLLWRRILNKIWESENCVMTFKKRSYIISFFVIKDEENKEMNVYNLKIE